MKVDTISEAKAQLSALVDRALAGEEANSTIRIISARKANRAEQRQYESR